MPQVLVFPALLQVGVGSGWRMKTDGLRGTGLWLFQPTSGKQLCFLHEITVYNLFLKNPKRQEGMTQDLVSCGIEKLLA